MSWRPTCTALAAALLLIAGVAVPTAAEAATAKIVPTHQGTPSGGTTTIGAGVDGANQNAQFAESLPATVAPNWRNAPPLCPSSGGVGPSSISVTTTLTIVSESQYQCSSISAYDVKTGALRWRKQYHFADAATVTAGKVVVVHDDLATSMPRVDTLAVDTGKLLWSSIVGSQGGNAVSVGSGVVTNGPTVLSLATGKSLFAMPTDLGTPGTSLAAGGRVFYASGSGTVATDTKGKILWHTMYPAGIRGAWLTTDTSDLAQHAGLLYVPGSKTIVLDVKTGRVVRTLPASRESIAFDGNTGFFSAYGDTSTPAAPSTIRAIDLTTGAVLWSHPFPMKETNFWHPDTAPLVSNGLVWATSTSDSIDPTTVVALDEVTGAQRSEFVATCADGGGGGNVAIAQHRLFVSTACGVQTYVAAKTIPVATRADELFPDPGFEHGAGHWTALGAATVRTTTSPVHGGKGAITVAASTTAPGTVGFTYTIATNGPRHAWFDATCWVRPSTPGMSVAFRAAEWAPGTDQPVTVRGTDVPELTQGVWTQIHTNGYIDDEGDSLALQVQTSGASAVGGTLTLDDCSAWGTLPTS